MDQTKTKPQTFEFKNNKSTDTFSFDNPLLLEKDGKWMLGPSLLEVDNYVFDLT